MNQHIPSPQSHTDYQFSVFLQHLSIDASSNCAILSWVPSLVHPLTASPPVKNSGFISPVSYSRIDSSIAAKEFTSDLHCTIGFPNCLFATTSLTLNYFFSSSVFLTVLSSPLLPEATTLISCDGASISWKTHWHPLIASDSVSGRRTAEIYPLTYLH